MAAAATAFDRSDRPHPLSLARSAGLSIETVATGKTVASAARQIHALTAALCALTSCSSLVGHRPQVDLPEFEPRNRLEAILEGYANKVIGARSEEHTSELQSLMRI